METNTRLPIYKITFSDSEDSGVDFIALVSEPAIEVNWKAFAAEQERFLFAIADQQKLAGPMLIPDLPIYRRDEAYGEYYVVFDRQTVLGLAEKYNRSLKQNNINIEHQEGQVIKAFMAENWIVDDPALDKSAKFGFNDLPAGTWFGIVKVEDEKFWQDQVKTEKVRGFSIEGWLGMQIKNNKQNMENTTVELKAATLADGTEIKVTDFVVGADVTYTDESGNEVPLADGDYTTSDGYSFTVAGGKITEISQETAAPADNADMAAPADAAPADTAAPADAPADQPDPMIKELEGKISLLEERLKAIEDAMKADNTKMEEMSAKIESFSKTPGATSVTKLSKEKKTVTIDDATKRVIEMRNAAK